jgi:diacylglycerol kinase family enzyme
MKRTLLINNSNSGNANALEDGALTCALEAAGFDVVGTASLPDDDLPSLSDLMAHDIQTLAICAGDGTVSSICAKLAGWSGDVLVLPGGTMNLLSRRLHG